MLHLIAASGAVVAFVAAVGAGTLGAAERFPQSLSPVPVFVTLPMTNGFVDATDDLVEVQGLVEEALAARETVRLVDGPQESAAVLTVLGRGTGSVDLTAAMTGLDRGIVASPVLIRPTERYIEAMLIVGSCGETATNTASQIKSASCYRKIFVGLGLADRNARQSGTKPNSWTACANALARDVQAWITQNASRLPVLRG
jgi:hypothetical protein